MTVARPPVFGFLDGVMVMNLKIRPDRRAEIQAQLDRVGLTVDGEQISYFDAVRPDEAGQFPSIGCKGNFLSHLGILEHAVRKGWDSIGVFEDDLDFAEDFTTRIDATKAALAQLDWKIFFAGYHLPEGDKGLSRVGGFLSPSVETPVQMTHFICFRGAQTIKAVAEHLATLAAREAGDPRGGPMFIDGAIHWYRRNNPDALCILADPPLGIQRASRSDIADLKWYDKTPLVSTAVGVMRRFRRR